MTRLLAFPLLLAAGTASAQSQRLVANQTYEARGEHPGWRLGIGERIVLRPVLKMRSEERNRLVAPVVHTPGRRVVRIELEYRQQLHRRDAELLQIRDFLDQPRIRAAAFGRDA